jgi:hypothetical protein
MSGRITIAGHPAEVLVPGTLNSPIKPADVLQKIFNLLPLYPGLLEDLKECAGREIAPVHRDDNPALLLRLIEDVVAPLHAVQHKSLLLQDLDYFLCRECRKFRRVPRR